jgi:hypothetical protein
VINSTVVMGSSVHGRVSRSLPAWSKCMTIAMQPASISSLQETNTIGY